MTLTIVASLGLSKKSNLSLVTFRKTGIRFNSRAVELIGDVDKLSLATDDDGCLYFVADQKNGYTVTRVVQSGAAALVGKMNARAILVAIKQRYPRTTRFELSKVDGAFRLTELAA